MKKYLVLFLALVVALTAISPVGAADALASVQEVKTLGTNSVAVLCNVLSPYRAYAVVNIVGTTVNITMYKRIYVTTRPNTDPVNSWVVIRPNLQRGRVYRVVVNGVYYFNIKG